MVYSELLKAAASVVLYAAVVPSKEADLLDGVPSTPK